MKEMVERRAAILPIESNLKLSILDDGQIEKIHEATLEILENVGVHIPLEKALKIFSDAGAKVDFKSEIVKLPNDLVMNNVKKAPRYYTLAARGGEELDVNLNDKQTFFANSSAATNIIDFKTREKRSTRKEDVAMTAKIIDYLPAISFHYGPLASAQDKLKTAPLHELEAVFKNTSKHVMTESLVGEDLARFAVEMGAIVSRGKKNLRKKPILSILICTISPLGQDPRGLGSALIFAEAGLPVGFMSMPTFGSTAPASQAGALAMGMAEILSAITLLQIAYPGTPVFSTLIPGMIDPRSAKYLSASPFAQIADASAVQLSHFYNIPICNGTTFGGSALELDRWQVGRENVYLPFLSVLSGAEMALGLGSMNEATLVYPERILFDQEIVQCISHISAGIEVNDKTLATGIISQVKPRGHFLNQKHTAENLPKLWPQSILYKKSRQKGVHYRDPQKVAREQIEWILDNHKPSKLDDKIESEIKRLLETADKEIS